MLRGVGLEYFCVFFFFSPHSVSAFRNICTPPGRVGRRRRRRRERAARGGVRFNNFRATFVRTIRTHYVNGRAGQSIQIEVDCVISTRIPLLDSKRFPVLIFVHILVANEFSNKYTPTVLLSACTTDLMNDFQTQ